MNLIQGPHVGYWVAAQVQGAYSRDTAQAIGLERNGEIVAGAVFEDWNQRSIVVHLAIRGRAAPVYFWMIADYAFHQCGVHKVIAPIGSHNQKMLNLAYRIGFQIEACIKDAQPYGDILLCTLVEKDCRFLEDKRYGAHARLTEPEPRITCSAGDR